MEILSHSSLIKNAYEKYSVGLIPGWAQGGLRIQHCCSRGIDRSFGVGCSCLNFDLWTGNFRMLQVRLKKKRKRSAEEIAQGGFMQSKMGNLTANVHLGNSWSIAAQSVLQNGCYLEHMLANASEIFRTGRVRS